MTNYTIHTERLNPFENDKGYTVLACLFDAYGQYILVSSHGSGDTIEAAEDKAIERAVALLRAHEAGASEDTGSRTGPQLVQVVSWKNAARARIRAKASHEDGTVDNTVDEPAENPSEEISVDNSEAEIDPLDGEPMNVVISVSTEETTGPIAEEDAIVIDETPVEEPAPEEPKAPPQRTAPSFLRSNKPSFDTVGTKQSRAAKPKPATATKVETTASEAVDPRVHEDWDKRLANGGVLIVPEKDDTEAWDATSSAVDEVVKAAKVRMTLVNFYAKNTAWFDALKANFPGAYELTINTMSAKRQALEA